MLSQDQIRQFHADGYFILDPGIEPGLLATLREAAERVARKARSGEWPHRRSMADGDIWGVSSLLHPDLNEPVFAEYMATRQVLETAADLIGPSMYLTLVNMLVNPSTKDYAIAWHRDGIKADIADEAEKACLDQMQYGVQWNAALYRESCLLIVPGSHCRVRTPEEREVAMHRPMGDMPGQMAVALQAGQTVYYNAQLLHRGIYSKDVRRCTLHACLVSTQRSEVFKPHYDAVRFMDSPGFRDRLPGRLRPLYDNWLDYFAAFRGQAR